MQDKIKRLIKPIIHPFLRRKKTPTLPTLLKPFTLKDLKPLPKQWQIKPPDFVGVAAGKSGTSWWYSLLLKHPQVVPNRLGMKELHYFDHFKYQGISEQEMSVYNQAFAAPDNCICGEWSPNYLTHPFCIEYLAKTCPNTKILLMLRNPVDRMISQINYLSQVRLNDFNFNANERYLYELYTIYLNGCIHSYYSGGLKQLLKYFDRSQILVLQYEHCQVNPLKEIQKTYQFLQIDWHHLPQNISKSVNKISYSIPELTPESQKRITEFLREEMQETAALFPEIDLSLWGL
jgi:hypothetical protein